MGDPSGTGRMRQAPVSGIEVANVVRPRGCVKGTSTAQLLRLRPPFTARYPALGRARRRHDRASALARRGRWRSEEHTSELQSRGHLVCRPLLDKKNMNEDITILSDVYR